MPQSKYQLTYQSSKFYISIFAFVLISLSFMIFSRPVFAGPQSTNYEIKTYDFGSGGTQETTSTNYAIQGQTGTQDAGQTTSTNYAANGGLTFVNQASVPPAPTFTNPATNYDRLKITLDTTGNASDTKYAIAISSDNFATDTRYLQSDNTIGTVLGAEDWQTNATWGPTGFFVKTLEGSTTYTIKVKAQNGKYTETAWGPTAQVATVSPSLTFGISQSTLTFNNLNSGNSYTDSTKFTTLTTSTNAYYGYTIFGHETGVLTSGTNTIDDYPSPNSAPTTWSGSDYFGYTTSDSNLAGGTADRFTNPSAKYAGFTTSTPGDPVADHTAIIEDPAVFNEQFTISYRVTASATKQAGTYTNKIIYVVVPTY